MKLEYQFVEAPKHLENLKSNYEAHNKLMANVQLSGVFSDKLISRVYSLSSIALDVRIEQEKCNIENDKAERRLQELCIEFQGLFNAYNIFSQEFKDMSFNLFSAVCSNKNTSFYIHIFQIKHENGKII
jgi:hypothetical protein